MYHKLVEESPIIQSYTEFLQWQISHLVTDFTGVTVCVICLCSHIQLVDTRDVLFHVLTALTSIVPCLMVP